MKKILYLPLKVVEPIWFPVRLFLAVMLIAFDIIFFMTIASDNLWLMFTFIFGYMVWIIDTFLFKGTLILWVTKTPF